MHVNGRNRDLALAGNGLRLRLIAIGLKAQRILVVPGGRLRDRIAAVDLAGLRGALRTLHRHFCAEWNAGRTITGAACHHSHADTRLIVIAGQAVCQTVAKRLTRLTLDCAGQLTAFRCRMILLLLAADHNIVDMPAKVVTRKVYCFSYCGAETNIHRFAGVIFQRNADLMPGKSLLIIHHRFAGYERLPVVTVRRFDLHRIAYSVRGRFRAAVRIKIEVIARLHLRFRQHQTGILTVRRPLVQCNTPLRSKVFRKPFPCIAFKQFTIRKILR